MAYRASKVHLTFQSGTQWGVACMYGVDSVEIKGVVGHQQGVVMTGDPRAVNCLACKKSVAYADAQSKLPRAQ